MFKNPGLIRDACIGGWDQFISGIYKFISSVLFHLLRTWAKWREEEHDKYLLQLLQMPFKGWAAPAA